MLSWKHLFTLKYRYSLGNFTIKLETNELGWKHRLQIKMFPDQELCNISYVTKLNLR